MHIDRQIDRHRHRHRHRHKHKHSHTIICTYTYISYISHITSIGTQPQKAEVQGGDIYT